MVRLQSMPFLQLSSLEDWKEIHFDAYTRGGSGAYEQTSSFFTHTLYHTMTTTGRVPFVWGIDLRLDWHSLGFM